MNLTRMALIFLLITIPFMMISYMDTLALQKSEQAKQQYTELINNAINDGAIALQQTTEYIDSDGSNKHIYIDVEGVVDTVLNSYHYGFNAISPSDYIRLDQHLLALVIIGYDGFYIYGTREVTDPSGNKVLGPIISEKYFYTYEDSDYRMQVTLDDYVTVLDKHTLIESKGVIGEISALPTGITALAYEEQRLKVIRDTIASELSYTVSYHNRYTESLGVIYEFYLPLGNNNAWAGDIEDVGVMAFFQGHPLGGGQTLEMMAFSQGEVMLQDRVVGYIDVSGNPYYCDGTCTHVITDPEVKVFASAREAAMEGFYPCHMVGK